MNDRDYQDWLESQYTQDEIAERERAEFEAYHHHLMMGDGTDFAPAINNNPPSTAYVDGLPF